MFEENISLRFCEEKSGQVIILCEDKFDGVHFSTTCHVSLALP